MDSHDPMQPAVPAPAPASTAMGRARAFTFGDAEPVLDRRDAFGMGQAIWTGRWYEPPIPMLTLARVRHMGPHHSSAMKYKVNQLVRDFIPSALLSRGDFAKAALDYIATGNLYLQRIDNLAGRPLALRHAPAVWTRVGRGGVTWWVAPAQNGTGAPGQLGGIGVPFEGEVLHVLEPDLLQEVYGLPEYLSALQSGLLNEQATVFRRRYYLNGSHMGYILYVSEATLDEADSGAIEEAMDQAKGPGNFRNLFLHMPGGREKGVQVIPIGEASAKDEFLGIKDTTRDDVLAAHRVPPVVLGIVPKNAAGFGDPARAADAFHHAEIVPLQGRMLEINDQLGREAVRFADYQPIGAAPVVVPAR